MTQSNTNRLLGIADPSWPTTSLIEKRAIELGYEAVVTSTPGNLESQASEFGMVVVHLPKDGSIQSIIESMKLFDDAIQFIVLTDTSDQQSVKTLERIPGVSVFCVSTIDAISWNELFATVSREICRIDRRGRINVGSTVCICRSEVSASAGPCRATCNNKSRCTASGPDGYRKGNRCANIACVVRPR